MLLSQQRINLIGRILLLFKIHSMQYISIFLQAIKSKRKFMIFKVTWNALFSVKEPHNKRKCNSYMCCYFFLSFQYHRHKICIQESYSSIPEVYKYLQSIISRTLINCVLHVPQIETHFLQKKLNKIKKNCCFSLSWCFVLV